MRKIIILLLTALLMTSVLCGCHDHTTPPTDLDLPDEVDGVEDRFVYAAKMYGKLIRYDVIDKKAVIACSDPLCGHDTSSCLATNIFTAYVSHDYIMYGRMDDGALGGYTILCYDLKGGNVMEVLECPGYQAITFIGDAAYFSASHVEYDDNGKPQGSVWDVYRYTMASGELVKLNNESLGSAVSVQSYTDDHILWWDMGGRGSFYTTDFSFNNKVSAANENRMGNYSYDFRTDYAEDGSFTYTIDRTSDEGKLEEVVSGIFSYRLDNIDDPHGIVYNINTEDEWKTIYYKDLSDLSTKKLGRVPDGYNLTSDGVYPEIGTSLYAGGYIGIYVTRDDADHAETHSAKTVWFVNIENGDNFVVTP